MLKKVLIVGIITGFASLFSTQVLAHGDVTPQAVDTTGLPDLGEDWVDENPFRNDEALKPKAVEIGSSAYNQNCARCHGLQAISGGIAPDLRYLEADFDGDEWYIERVTNGAVRDGKVYMPKFVGTISQTGLWAIRTYIDEQAED